MDSIYFSFLFWAGGLESIAKNGAAAAAAACRGIFPRSQTLNMNKQFSVFRRTMLLSIPISYVQCEVNPPPPPCK